jgi:hypothetical protein
MRTLLGYSRALPLVLLAFLSACSGDPVLSPSSSLASGFATPCSVITSAVCTPPGTPVTLRSIVSADPQYGVGAFVFNDPPQPVPLPAGSVTVTLDSTPSPPDAWYDLYVLPSIAGSSACSATKGTPTPCAPALAVDTSVVNHKVLQFEIPAGQYFAVTFKQQGRSRGSLRGTIAFTAR